ncbi:hypothetical protein PUN28_014735 [Cardiocondyla obscurior]|uniref:Uncharacterized protein n=1 Tax=Cardiocondyla obscurior TaxID=286306 RepID=A0AAW2EV63_9HYME
MYEFVKKRCEVSLLCSSNLKLILFFYLVIQKKKKMLSNTVFLYLKFKLKSKVSFFGKLQHLHPLVSAHKPARPL